MLFRSHPSLLRPYPIVADVCCWCCCCWRCCYRLYLCTNAVCSFTASATNTTSITLLYPRATRVQLLPIAQPNSPQSRRLRPFLRNHNTLYHRRITIRIQTFQYPSALIDTNAYRTITAPQRRFQISKITSRPRAFNNPSSPSLILPPYTR